jgi:hypothetical protein
LTAVLPEAVRLLVFKADGSVLVHDDAGGYKPLNRIRREFRPEFRLVDASTRCPLRGPLHGSPDRHVAGSDAATRLQGGRLRAQPLGRAYRRGSPDRVAVCTDDARWITGQMIDSEGGFRRWAS